MGPQVLRPMRTPWFDQYRSLIESAQTYLLVLLAAVGVSVVGAGASEEVHTAQEVEKAAGAALNRSVTGRVASGDGGGNIGSTSRHGSGVGSSREGDDSEDLGELHVEGGWWLTVMSWLGN